MTAAVFQLAFLLKLPNMFLCRTMFDLLPIVWSMARCQFTGEKAQSKNVAALCLRLAQHDRTRQAHEFYQVVRLHVCPCTQFLQILAGLDTVPNSSPASPRSDKALLVAHRFLQDARGYGAALGPMMAGSGLCGVASWIRPEGR